MFPTKSKNRDVRPRLFLYGEKFPEKLYSVVQDGFLLSWDETGEKINIGDPPSGHSSGRWKSEGPQRFENLVMDLYPGFVQIPQFANLRRLFREYSFNWHLSTSGHFNFSHPCFVRGRTDLLAKIKTRRKSVPLYGFRRNTRRRSLRRPLALDVNKKDLDVGQVSSYDPKSDKFSESFRSDDVPINEGKKRSSSPCRMGKDQLQNIYKSFIKNELEHDITFQGDTGSSSPSSSHTSGMLYEEEGEEEEEDKTDLPTATFSMFLLADEESSSQNLEDHFFIENENYSDYLFEWTQGPHGYLRPVLNSDGIITRTYYPL